MNSSIERFTDEQLDQIADAVGLSLEKFRPLAAVAEEGTLFESTDVDLDIAQAEEANCKDIDFNIKVVRIKGQACFTPGTNWRLAVDLQVSAFGIELDRVNYTFSPAQTSVTYKYNLLVGKLTLTLGVRYARICLFTSGKASSLGKSKSWNVNLFCFR